MKLRYIVRVGAALAIGILFCLIGVDIILDYLPVRMPFGTQPTSVTDPVLHFRPNQDFTFSLGWDFKLINHGHINNAGFINNETYNTDASGPLLAVIGNSMIQAAMVPYSETIQGRLAKALEEKARVYSFGVSNSDLPQYLIFARMAHERYHASALIFVVTFSDILWSLLQNDPKAPGHYVYIENNGHLDLTRVDLPPASALRKYVSSQPLGQYLFFNLEVPTLVKDALHFLLLGPTEERVDLRRTASFERQRAESEAISAAFLRDLPTYSGLPADRILFLVDGHHAPGERTDYFASDIFSEAARQQGYEVIEMGPIFLSAWKPGRRFDISKEVPGNHHWNGRGHKFAAQAALGSRLLRALVSSTAVR